MLKVHRMKPWSPPNIPPVQAAASRAESEGDGDASREELLRQAAQTLREELGGKRSDKLLRLFDFLLERTLESRPPTELEIANAVFASGEPLDAPKDSTVRVYVHRLRKMLEETYRDQPGPRLMIPVGEYSISLIGVAAATPAPAAVPEPAAVEPAPAAAPPRYPPQAGRLALAAIGLLGLCALLFFMLTSQGPLAAGTPAASLWQPLASSDRPITIVMGDYFLFGQNGAEKPPAGAPPRLVWERSVLVREDLDIYLMHNPTAGERITGAREQYISSGTLQALEKINNTLRNLEGGRARSVRLIAASQLTPDIFKSSDVVYVGLLSGLNVLLRDPLFQVSGFALDDGLTDLMDKATGTHYQSDGVVLTEERIPRMDYGYIASLPGPADNRIMVIAGIRDPGLLEMAELASDPARLATASALQADQPSHGFEALYKVRTMGTANLGATLVLRRDLQIQGIWDRSKALTGPGAVPAPPERPVSPKD